MDVCWKVFARGCAKNGVLKLCECTWMSARMELHVCVFNGVQRGRVAQVCECM